jgi:OmpA-OmpF porin, OOP family
MIKELSKPILVAAALATLGMGASTALAQTTGVMPYAIDQRGVVARSGTGLCWRTGYWTPQLAAETKLPGAEFPVGCECDKDLMPKEKCEPPPPPPPPKAEEAPPPPPPPKPAAEKFSLAADTLFDFDKATLRPEGKQKLDEVATKVKDIKLEVIIAVGHADRIGNDKYNQKLSERRAESVKAYFVSKGIEPNRVYTEGKGEKQPKTKPGECNMRPENHKNKKLVACLQPDRRVEIEVIGTK